MPRRYRRRRYAITRPVKTAKYSNETYSALGIVDASRIADSYVLLSASTPVLGTRKAKNFTLTIVTDSDVPFFFALVFVPQGTEPGSLTASSSVDEGVLLASSLYEPNQNVIISGSFGGPNSAVERFKTRLARNLNSGDSIVLIFKNLVIGTADTHVAIMCNYAISY